MDSVHRPVESLWTNYAVVSPSAASDPRRSRPRPRRGFLDLARAFALGGSLFLGLDDLLDGRGARRGLLGGGCLGCALALGLLGLELGELLLGRELLALGGDDELQVAVTSVKTSNGTVYRPIRLIVSISSLRRSTRSFSCSQSRSATFVAVTEPKSEPVGPALTSKRSSSPSIRSAIARASSTRLRVVAGPLGVAPLELAHEPGRRHLGEAAREEEVARVAARDVDDLAAETELVDVLLENDFHRHLLVADVREEGELAGALDGDGHLALMAPAGTADAAVADLALLRHVPPELVDVLVVDLVDLRLAEEAGLAAARTCRRVALASAAAALAVGISLGCWH